MSEVSTDEIDLGLTPTRRATSSRVALSLRSMSASLMREARRKVRGSPVRRLSHSSPEVRASALKEAIEDLGASVSRTVQGAVYSCSSNSSNSSSTIRADASAAREEEAKRWRAEAFAARRAKGRQRKLEAEERARGEAEAHAAREVAAASAQDPALCESIMKMSISDPSAAARKAAAAVVSAFPTGVLVALMASPDLAVAAAAVGELSRPLELSSAIVVRRPEELEEHALPPSAFTTDVSSALIRLRDDGEDERAAAISELAAACGAIEVSVHARFVLAALSDSVATVRKTALEILGRLQPSELLGHVDKVISVLEADADAGVRCEAAKAIHAVGGTMTDDAARKAAAVVLVSRLQDASRPVRNAAAAALPALGMDDADQLVPVLLSMLDHESTITRLSALRKWRSLPSGQIAPYAKHLARVAKHDKDSVVRYEAGNLIVTPETYEMVTERLKQSDEMTRRARTTRRNVSGSASGSSSSPLRIMQTTVAPVSLTERANPTPLFEQRRRLSEEILEEALES
jgi:hypothetical protein